jgi:hypothetical protein
MWPRIQLPAAGLFVVVLTMSLDVDTALSAVGAFGLHQKVSFGVMCVPAAVAAFVTMANVFITYTMKHRLRKCSWSGRGVFKNMLYQQHSR